MEGNLYDYPRESIERRKLVRQLRRYGLQSGITLPDAGDDDIAAQRHAEIYRSLVELESELAKFEQNSRLTGA